jgi:hypothetical protein
VSERQGKEWRCVFTYNLDEGLAAAMNKSFLITRFDSLGADTMMDFNITYPARWTLVVRNDEPERAAFCIDWSAIDAVGDEHFRASNSRVQFSQREDDFVSVLGFGNHASGHELAAKKQCLSVANSLPAYSMLPSYGERRLYLFV